jgi:hypothetical protein
MRQSLDARFEAREGYVGESCASLRCRPISRPARGSPNYQTLNVDRRREISNVDRLAGSDRHTPISGGSASSGNPQERLPMSVQCDDEPHEWTDAPPLLMEICPCDKAAS